MPFGDVLVPAIRLAHDGFGLSELNVKALGDAKKQLGSHPDLYPAWAAYFEKPIGDCRIGALFRQPELARTYEAISKDGPNYLYGGPLGAALVQAARDNGGCLSEDDVIEVAARWLEPLATPYRDHKVSTTPEPSHGYQCLVTLKLFEHLTPFGNPDDETDRLDLLFRCIRIAARARIEGDGSVEGLGTGLLEDERIAWLAERVRTDDGVRGPTEHAGGFGLADRKRENTTSFTVGDRHGNLVTITQSLGQYFGSGVVVAGHGIVLNDLLHYGYLDWHRGGGRRALDLSISPVILQMPTGAMVAFGPPGGFGIPQTQAQVLINLVDRGMRLQQAFDEPRARLWPGTRTEVEARLAEKTRNGLSSRGHGIEASSDWTKIVGGMHGIHRHADTGLLEGAADRRRDGYVTLC